MSKRYKIRFKDIDTYQAAMAAEATPMQHTLESRDRHFIVVEASESRVLLESGTDTPTLSLLENSMSVLEREYGAELVEDYQYELEVDAPAAFEIETEAPEDDDPSLDDVVEKVRADAAWAESRGKGVTIAVVDTGIDGTRPEFPVSKRAGDWTPPGDTPWTDWEGHGSMCACIAAGTKAGGGVFNGIAPDAQLIACKTRFYDSELTLIYDYLTSRAKDGERIVATNSFGTRTGTPPPVPAHSDFPDALTDAINAGVIVCFSAGNYHDLAGGAPTACDPNSIWLHKCRDDVLTVATCDLTDTMWYYSSRGPGQHFGDPGTNEKPNVTAPTPKNGRVVYGGGISRLPNGWGTSGACPQVAGLAALLLAKNPALNRSQVFNAITSTATDIGHGVRCQGTGRIDCARAIASI